MCERPTLHDDLFSSCAFPLRLTRGPCLWRCPLCPPCALHRKKRAGTKQSYITCARMPDLWDLASSHGRFSYPRLFFLRISLWSLKQQDKRQPLGNATIAYTCVHVRAAACTAHPHSSSPLLLSFSLFCTFAFRLGGACCCGSGGRLRADLDPPSLAGFGVDLPDLFVVDKPDAGWRPSSENVEDIMRDL